MKPLVKICFLWVPLLMSAANVRPAHAATEPSLIVTTNSDSSTNGDGETSLREAIDYANSLPGIDDITFSSFFDTPRTITLDSNKGNLNVSEGVNINTINRPAGPITITQDGLIRLFNFNNGAGGASEVSNLTLSGGGGNPGGQDGGAILAQDANPANGGPDLKVTNCVFTGNKSLSTAGFGGAIFARGGLVITGSTFSNNQASVVGGAIYYNSAKALSISNSTFSGNSTTGTSTLAPNDSFGGAIALEGSGSLTLTGSSFTNNLAAGSGDTYGGAIDTGSSGSTVNISGSTFSGNSATRGGGAIYNESGVTLTLTNSTLSTNSVTGGGGLIIGGGLANIGNAIVSGSTFNGNTLNPNAGNSAGGGISNADVPAPATASDLKVTNSTFVGNSANFGGGIANITNGTTTISSCTITNNTSYADGGGLDGVCTVRNTIIAGNHDNTAPLQPDVRSSSVISQGYNLIGVRNNPNDINNAPGDQYGTLANPLDPKFDSTGLANNGGPTQTVALQQFSPAVEKGNSFGLTTDQRGQTRPFDDPNIAPATGGDNSDIGAFELQTAVPVATTGALITEFRFNGPGSGTNEYAELYNNTTGPLNISGWSLQYMVGGTITTTTIPAATILPARGHYLLAGSAYNLTSVAARDLALGGNIAYDSFLRLRNASNAEVDYIKPALAPNGTPAEQYAFVRSVTSGGTPGVPIDTDSPNDFVFVSTSGAVIDGIQSQLGAPSPENTRSPVQRDAIALVIGKFDGSAAYTASPNQQRYSLPDQGANSPNRYGTLRLRRSITNNTGQTITRLRFHVVTITTLNSPGYSNPSQADVRLLTSPNEPGLNVIGTTLEAPSTNPPGGGLNSNTVALNQALAPGATANYSFELGVARTGNFAVGFTVEVLPAP